MADRASTDIPRMIGDWTLRLAPCGLFGKAERPLPFAREPPQPWESLGSSPLSRTTEQSLGFNRTNKAGYRDQDHMWSRCFEYEVTLSGIVRNQLEQRECQRTVR
jgi:hypothetical protein